MIAATNRLPWQAVAAGKLREDLLYRLNVFPIELPPLRDRLSDVGLLAGHFLTAIGQSEGAVKRFSPTALQCLAQYNWPGNVRELRNVVQRAYVMAATDTIDESWLPGASPVPATAPVQASAAAMAGSEGDKMPLPQAVGDSLSLPIGTSMADAERALILATLRHYQHRKERTAAALGISLKTLYNRLKDYAAEGEGTVP